MDKSAKTFFVTGTDTEVGKTLVSSALLNKAKVSGLSTAALKPVAAGCDLVNGEWVNEDVLSLSQQVTLPLTFDEINPVKLRSPIAPHIAAQQEDVELSVACLSQGIAPVLDKNADFTLVEGAGGWFVPLNDQETLADFAEAQQLPVIFVVGMRLGCLNHALLTEKAILDSGLKIAGWVATQVQEEMPVADENFDTLKKSLPYPCLGRIPFIPNITPVKAAEYLDIQALI